MNSELSNLHKRIKFGKRAFYALGTVSGLLYLIKNRNIYFVSSDLDDQIQGLNLKHSDHKSYTEELEAHLKNREPLYVDAPPIEKLISLPRYQHVLYLIKQANQNPTKLNKKRLIEDLLKLNNEKEDKFRQATININNTKNLVTINKTDAIDTTNPFLNNGLANHISQLLTNEFMFEMAFRAPDIDNRFFRRELPTIIEKLNKTCPDYASDSSPTRQETTSIYDDIDYALILEFHDKFSGILLDTKHEYTKNKTINLLLNKLKKELNALIVSEYVIKNRPKLSIWSTDDEDINYTEYEDDIVEINKQPVTAKDAEKLTNLKQKIKQQFVERNEALIMNLIDLMVRINVDEFVNMMGMDFLLFLYEKHKYEESYLVPIGDCLTLISLHEKYRNLFIYSGWLKRLNQMCNKKMFGAKLKSEKASGSIDLIRELIAHKILFNLNQNDNSESAKNKVKYSTMLFPVYPMYSNATRQLNRINHEHNHLVDVVFVHGLRGSLFRTWRQNDDSYPSLSKIDKNVSSNQPNATNTIEDKILDKLNNFIDIQLNEKFSYCWPKDWLPYDLNLKQNSWIRLIGVSYNSFFSAWLEDVLDEKHLKSSIKQRAIELFEQLEQTQIGKRPVIFVTHSMGGIIVKQMLVHMKELSLKANKNSSQYKYLDEMIKNTKGIVFLSTPHLGSDVAKKVTNFSFALYTSNEIAELSTNSKYLIELNKKFLRLIQENSNKMKILSICETLPTYFALNVYATTVSETSANLGVGEFYLANNKDHLNVCKPDNKKCFLYTKIVEFINQISEHETNTCAKCILGDQVDPDDLKQQTYLILTNFTDY